MPYFTEDWIQELLNRIDIVEVVSGYVPLTNKSGRWWACCPFHNEKTPSFSVNPQKGFFHCFGCGKGGSAIHFVMEKEKMTFPEACTYLAEKAKLEVPQQTNNIEYEKKKALIKKIQQMNREAAQYFHANLMGKAGAGARNYLQSRGFGNSIIKAFGLGFAPDAWDGLLTLFTEKGYTKQDMQTAGLIKINEDKCYDVFRNRLMMPIIDTFSNVIGFGGRVMDDSMPKYLNSPETAAFSKSKNLYNLNMIRKQKNIDYLILVEGYMDVIALCAHNIMQSVATLGTALTAGQAKILRRYTKNVYVSYDGDEAGKKATLRAVDILEAEGLDVKVITIPGAGDPDDYLKANKKDGYMKLMKNAQTVVEYKFDRIAERYDMQNGDEKEKFTQECIGVLKKLQSAVLREKYAKSLSARTGFSLAAIFADIGGERKKEQEEFSRPAPKNMEEEKKDLKTENELMMALLMDPEKIGAAREYLSAEDFSLEENSAIFSAILGYINKGIVPGGAELLTVLEKEEHVKHAASLMEMAGEGPAGLTDDSFIIGLAKRKRLQNKKQQLKELVKQADGIEDKDAHRQKVKALTDEIQNLKI